MSGEDSKRSGELGEKLAGAFFEAIGWASKLQSLSVTCNNAEHRTVSDKDKRSHGDDRVFIYNSPFFDNKTDIVHISVKNNLNGYPQSESTLKSDFKKFIEEANQIIECAQYDEKLLHMLSPFKGRKHKEHSGLLFWSSSDNASHDKDILSVVKNVKSLGEECKKNIYFVDGARINFLLKIIEHIKIQKIESYEFYYPETGSINRQNDRHGSILPLELIVSDLIPIKASIDKDPVLFMYVNQAFDKECYRRVISLALAFGGGWPSEFRIGFPDYNAAFHLSEAGAAELAFTGLGKKFIPFCFVASNLNALEV